MAVEPIQMLREINHDVKTPKKVIQWRVQRFFERSAMKMTFFQ